MKLTYRGASYDYNPPTLEVTKSDVAMQYRGQKTRYTYVQHVPIPQPAERLTYRGAAYQTTRQGQVLSVAGSQGLGTAQPAAMDQSMNPSLSRQQASQKIAQSGRTGVTTLSLLRDRLMGVSPAAQARRQLLQEASHLHHDNVVRSLQRRMAVAKEQGNDLLVQQLESEMSQSR
ncbi:MAG: DUF4278 domain-containing protein [Phormidesmis sp.]